MILSTINDKLTYKNYTAEVKADTDAGVLRGQVLDIKDTITFEGNTLSEAVQDFRRAIDDYIAFCEELGQSPDEPFSGRFLMRTSPDKHRMFYLAAQRANKTLNDWVEDKAMSAAQRELSDYPHAS
ncbi:MAG: type II toxin-antitoxin system HicB family antitoxin [Cyanobacteria bacterium P01_A01_bin.135]